MHSERLSDTGLVETGTRGQLRVVLSLCQSTGQRIRAGGVAVPWDTGNLCVDLQDLWWVLVGNTNLSASMEGRRGWEWVIRNWFELILPLSEVLVQVHAYPWKVIQTRKIIYLQGQLILSSVYKL